MPTKHAVGFAEFDLVSLLMPKHLDRSGIRRAFDAGLDRIKYGGLRPRDRWLRLFDPKVTDLSTLPIGLFDQRVLMLPRKYLPETREGLAKLCRQLIDRAEDEEHLALMLRSWPATWSFSRHVDELWDLRSRDRQYYEDVVRGRHGRALCRIADREEIGGVTVERARKILVRQALIWCAFDAQLTTSRARVSLIAPVGKLLSTTMKLVKGGTILRLMNKAHEAMMTALWDYQTAEDEADDGSNNAKPKGKQSKAIAHQAEKRIDAGSKPLSAFRAELDASIPELRGMLPQVKQGIEQLESYMTAELTPKTASDGSTSRRTNSLRHFHPIWFSNLTPAAGMAVGLFRFALAEKHLMEMVEAAANPPKGSNLPIAQVNALPPLPDDLDEMAALIERVLDLSNSARRVHLRDQDWRSRTRIELSEIKKALEEEEKVSMMESDLVERDPLDKAGLTFINQARRFLQDMGQRERDAYHARHAGDHRHFTYWHMDVVPEHRLAI